jgi:hypothetical protein
MTILSEHRRHQESLEIASWVMPSPQVPKEMLPAFSSADAAVPALKGVGNIFVGDDSKLPELGPLASFGTWASVASTIMYKIEQLAGFDPTSLEFDAVAWEAYMKKFSTMPFFLGFNRQSRVAHVSPLSLKSAVDELAFIMKPIATGDALGAVVTSIKKIAQLALLTGPHMEGGRKTSFQRQGFLRVVGGELFMVTLQTSVDMEYKSTKNGYEQCAQDINIIGGYGQVDLDKCIRSASALLSWDKRDVETWERATSSASLPPNASPAWSNG